MIKNSAQSLMGKAPALDTRRASSTRNSAETRQRILNAARRCFSLRSYENVGIREIATDAGVDSALVNRYFGNKEGLFAQVVQGAFDVEEHLPVEMANIGEFLAEQVLRDGNETDNGGFNPLKLLLLAAASPDTAGIVSDRFHAEFVQPLAEKLGGENTPIRAALIGSYVIGLATMRHLLHSPAFDVKSGLEAARRVSTAIQACVDNGA